MFKYYHRMSFDNIGNIVFTYSSTIADKRAALPVVTFRRRVAVVPMPLSYGNHRKFHH